MKTLDDLHAEYYHPSARNARKKDAMKRLKEATKKLRDVVTDDDWADLIDPAEEIQAARQALNDLEAYFKGE